MERTVRARLGEDAALVLVPGGDLITAEQLPDGIHPGDEGHHILATVIGGAVAATLPGRTP